MLVTKQSSDQGVERPISLWFSFWKRCRCFSCASESERNETYKKKHTNPSGSSFKRKATAFLVNILFLVQNCSEISCRIAIIGKTDLVGCGITKHERTTPTSSVAASTSVGVGPAAVSSRLLDRLRLRFRSFRSSMLEYILLLSCSFTAWTAPLSSLSLYIILDNNSSYLRFDSDFAGGFGNRTWSTSTAQCVSTSWVVGWGASVMCCLCVPYRTHNRNRESRNAKQTATKYKGVCLRRERDAKVEEWRSRRRRQERGGSDDRAMDRSSNHSRSRFFLLQSSFLTNSRPCFLYQNKSAARSELFILHFQLVV